MIIQSQRKLGLSERQTQAVCKIFKDYNDVTADILTERQNLQASILVRSTNCRAPCCPLDTINWPP